MRKSSSHLAILVLAIGSCTPIDSPSPVVHDPNAGSGVEGMQPMAGIAGSDATGTMASGVSTMGAGNTAGQGAGGTGTGFAMSGGGAAASGSASGSGVGTSGAARPGASGSCTDG